MEENNNKAPFSFNPDNAEKKEKFFEDENGKSKVVIEDAEGYLNREVFNNNTTLVNRPKTRKKMKNYGTGSNGFAGVATLAGILALAGLIIAFVSLRY